MAASYLLQRSSPNLVTVTPRCEILLVDFAGHPFTYGLASSLCESGVDTRYAFSAAVTSPKASFDQAVPVFELDRGREFDKYRPARRLLHETRFGLATARAAWRCRPKNLVMCNMPIVAGLVAAIASAPLRPRRVLWYQDVQSGLARSSLGALGRALSLAETLLLRLAHRVVAISERLRQDAIRRGVDSERVRVLENWAPLERFPPTPTRSSIIDSHDGPVFLYSGTLARKHNPELLVHIAEELDNANCGTMLVVSEGEGVDWLNEEEQSHRLGRLKTLPYQPFDAVPSLLASADVLVAVLEGTAGEFSVPSKVLSYLSAGRPVLAAMPSDNAASNLVTGRANAGIVIDPDDGVAWRDAVRCLLSDRDLRDRLGRNGRAFAEQNFNPAAVRRRFLDAIA